MNTRILFASLALTLAACGGGGTDDDSSPTTTGSAETFCADLAEGNAGCWSSDLDAQCLELYAECGERFAVAESCPVQISCAR